MVDHNPLNLDQSIEWISSGKILAHPTEGVWGLGCDALNKEAYLNLFKLKKRSSKKSFILLASSIQIVKKFSKPIDHKDEIFLNNHWPGPVTFLIKYKESIPDHLKNNTGKLAFRVSNHYPLKALFKVFNSVMVSTSANISGKQILNDGPEIIKTFANNNHLAYYDEELGKETKPTTIIDLHTREIIRP